MRSKPQPDRLFIEKLAESLTPQEQIPTQNPLDFARHLNLKLWQDVNGFSGRDKLTDILNAVAHNKHRFTVVESGHGPGKTMTAAAVACWWMERYKPEAVVVTLAPTHVQVNTILWRYIRKFHSDSKLSPTIFETPRWDVAPSCYAIGLSPRKATQEDLQALHGYHSPNLLVIMDEAPGLPRLMWEAVRGLCTGENSKILALGNPLEMAGPFHEAVNSPAWQHIHISDLEHPNVVLDKETIPGAVSRQWVDGMVHDHCARCGPGEPGAIEWLPGSGEHWLPGPVFQSRVLGQAPSEASDQLIALSWVTGAQGWTAEPVEADSVVLGLDPSRVSHGDQAAMVCRKGPLVLWVKRRRPRSANPSDELAGWLREERHKNGASRAFVEETGVGAGVVDRSRALGVPVVAVSPGAGASSRNMANKRAEMWWRLREQGPKFWYDGQGRVLLEPKDKIRSRLGRSPDSGDALALTFALPERAGLPEEAKAALTATVPSRWAVAGEKVTGSRWRK
jgi:hypothetical protein